MKGNGQSDTLRRHNSIRYAIINFKISRQLENRLTFIPSLEVSAPKKIKGKYFKPSTFATNVPKCTKISIYFQALPHHILCAILTVCLVPVFLGSTSVLEKKGQQVTLPQECRQDTKFAISFPVVPALQPSIIQCEAVLDISYQAAWDPVTTIIHCEVPRHI